jgi:hypothetical protein
VLAESAPVLGLELACLERRERVDTVRELGCVSNERALLDALSEVDERRDARASLASP